MRRDGLCAHVGQRLLPGCLVDTAEPAHVLEVLWIGELLNVENLVDKLVELGAVVRFLEQLAVVRGVREADFCEELEVHIRLAHELALFFSEQDRDGRFFARDGPKARRRCSQRINGCAGLGKNDVKALLVDLLERVVREAAQRVVGERVDRDHLKRGGDRALLLGGFGREHHVGLKALGEEDLAVLEESKLASHTILNHEKPAGQIMIHPHAHVWSKTNT